MHSCESSDPFFAFYSEYIDADVVSLKWNQYMLAEQSLKEIIPLLSDLLNRFHNTSFDNNYWALRLYPWLPLFLASTIDKFYYIRYLQDNHPDFDIFPTSPPIYNYSCYSYEDIVNALAYHHPPNISLSYEIYSFLHSKSLYSGKRHSIRNCNQSTQPPVKFSLRRFIESLYA